MAFVIYNSKQEAIDREATLTVAGVCAGYFPDGERYDIGGLVVFHPAEDLGAIEIFRTPGVVTPLWQDDIMPCNYEPLFTANELANTIDELTDDWFTTSI